MLGILVIPSIIRLMSNCYSKLPSLIFIASAFSSFFFCRKAMYSAVPFSAVTGFNLSYSAPSFVLHY